MGASTGPELIVSGGSIYVGEGGARWAEAMAVDGGRIVAIGGGSDIEALRGQATRSLDLEGAFVLPGLSDFHTHFLEGALSYGVDLSDAASREQFRSRVREALSQLPAGEWLVGGYWNEERWGGALPDRSWIEDISADNPVLLHRQDIHSALCNSAALAAAGIEARTPDPPGGEIVRGEDGLPTGILLESAVTPVKEAVPTPSRDRIRASLGRWMRRANSVGLTHVCDMVRDPEELGLYLDLEREGFLTCRFSVQPPLKCWERLACAGLRSGVGLELVTLGPLKAFVDGSLGTRTAYMFEPYKDDRGNRGRLSALAETRSALEEAMLDADRAGFQLSIHAIGDAANRIALDAFERVRRESPRQALRHRIEHAQHLDAADVDRFGELGLVVSVQPPHIAGDGCFAERRIGPRRCRLSFAFRALADAGAMLAFGSDWPVVEMGPLAAIGAAVTRHTDDGRNADGWVPQEKLTVAEALAASSRNAAFAAGAEERWGRLEPGLEADFVVLERDIFTCDPAEIGATPVLQTYLRGRRVFPEESE